jgi:putative glutamine amidotransferase
MRKAIIGLPAKLNKNFGASVPYVDYLQEFGDVIILANNDDPIDFLDALVLPGGLDVDPKRYGEKIGMYTGWPDRYLEEFDANLLPQYIEMLQDPNKPLKLIFGICRGMQTLNVHFGGSLYQDVLNLPYSDPRGKIVERSQVVNLKDQGIYTKTHEHNSLHHQAVKRLGNNLVPTLVGQKPGLVVNKNASKKGKAATKHNVDIIEGFRHETLPIFGMQYHPEEMYCEISSQIFRNHLMLNND